MKRIIKLTERDLTRIVRRVIQEQEIDRNEITEEFYEILGVLINLAEDGEFFLHVMDESQGTNETHGEGEPRETLSGKKNKREVYVRIEQPTYMLIHLDTEDTFFKRDFTDILTDRFRRDFPEMHFYTEPGYSIEVKPQKFVDQGYYDDPRGRDDSEKSV